MSKVKHPSNPTLFLCLGTSGAGLSTAINKAVKLGIVDKPPAQFTTRKLRPNEKSGDQYVPTTVDLLRKVSQHISIQGKLYGNVYGFFKPTIDKIKKTLSKRNLIVDTVNSPSEWKIMLGNNINIVSIFFAPEHPKFSTKRIILRAKNTGAKLSKNELTSRILGSLKIIKNIWSYDYWVDTTNLNTILPKLTSIVYYHSFNENKKPILKPISGSKSEIHKLISAYSTNN